MHTLKWSEKATRQFEKITDRKLNTNLYKQIQRLKNFPNCDHVKLLKSYKYNYRLRVGRYRILFNIINQVNIVIIEEVKKRDDQTY